MIFTVLGIIYNTVVGMLGDMLRPAPPLPPAERPMRPPRLAHWHAPQPTVPTPKPKVPTRTKSLSHRRRKHRGPAVRASPLYPNPFDPLWFPHIVDRLLHCLQHDGEWSTIHTLRHLSRAYRDHADASLASEVVLLSSQRPSCGMRFFLKSVNGSTGKRRRIPGLKQLGPYTNPEEVPPEVQIILKHVRTLHLRFWWWDAAYATDISSNNDKACKTEHILAPHMLNLATVGIADGNYSSPVRWKLKKRWGRHLIQEWPKVIPFRPRRLHVTTSFTWWWSNSRLNGCSTLPSLVGYEELRMEILIGYARWPAPRPRPPSFSHLKRVELVVVVGPSDNECHYYVYKCRPISQIIKDVISVVFDLDYLASFPHRCWFELQSRLITHPIPKDKQLHDAEGRLMPVPMVEVRKGITAALGSTPEAARAAARVNIVAHK